MFRFITSLRYSNCFLSGIGTGCPTKCLSPAPCSQPLQGFPPCPVKCLLTCPSHNCCTSIALFQSFSSWATRVHERKKETKEGRITDLALTSSWPKDMTLCIAAKSNPPAFRVQKEQWLQQGYTQPGGITDGINRYHKITLSTSFLLTCARYYKFSAHIYM